MIKLKKIVPNKFLSEYEMESNFSMKDSDINFILKYLDNCIQPPVLILRGMGMHSKPYLIKSIRKRRKLRNTKEYFNDIMNSFIKFLKKDNAIPDRTKCVFATTSYVSAKYYGDVHVIFPKKDCNIFYNLGYDDSFKIFSRNINTIFADITPKITSSILIKYKLLFDFLNFLYVYEYNPSKFKKLLKTINYDKLIEEIELFTNDLIKLNSGINPDARYGIAIRRTDDLLNTLLQIKRYINDIKKLKNVRELKNIEKYNAELMITGSGYIAIPYEEFILNFKYNKKLKKYVRDAHK